MQAALRAGAALFAAGHHRAAHEPWEDAWHEVRDAGDDEAATGADDPDGERDERLLQGLVQYAAAIHHARNRNWEGGVGLAASGREYLAGVPDGHRGVNVDAVRDALGALEADPERVERGPPTAVTVDGTAPSFADLDLDATLVVAPALAESLGYDRGTVERAVEYARSDVAAGEEGSEFVRFLFDFVREPENRGIVLQRLDQHVSRRKQREDDVKGLFE